MQFRGIKSQFKGIVGRETKPSAVREQENIEVPQDSSRCPSESLCTTSLQENLPQSPQPPSPPSVPACPPSWNNILTSYISLEYNRSFFKEEEEVSISVRLEGRTWGFQWGNKACNGCFLSNIHFCAVKGSYHDRQSRKSINNDFVVVVHCISFCFPTKTCLVSIMCAHHSGAFEIVLFYCYWRKGFKKLFYLLFSWQKNPYFGQL